MSNLHFDLLGTSFAITTDEDSVYLEKLLSRYKIVLENTQKLTGVKDPLKLAILTGYLLCDEIEKKKKEEKKEGRELEQRALNMIAQLDEVVPGTNNNGGSL